MLSAVLSRSAARARTLFTASSRRLGGHGAEVSIAKPSAIPGVPMAEDKKIIITFIDPENNRLPVVGLCGETLLETARRCNVNLQNTCGGKSPTSTVWDTGLQCYQCHVQVSNEHVDIVNKQNVISDSEKYQLGECDLERGDVTQNSRLCCQITLTPELDGMKVLIPTFQEADAV